MAWAGFYFHPPRTEAGLEMVCVVLPPEFHGVLVDLKYVQDNFSDLILKHYPDALRDDDGEVDIGMLVSGDDF